MSDQLDRFRQVGDAAIAGEEIGRHPIPLVMDNVVFRHTFEYTVADFPAEVGFYVAIFGFESVALTNEYALFTGPSGAFHVSFWQVNDDRPASSMAGLRMLFMTSRVDLASDHLQATGLVPDLTESQGSPVQRVLHLTSPAGLPIDVWEDPTTGEE